jgi:beta-galactosidase
VGGQIVLGPRTNSKTAGFAIPIPLPPALPGLDCTVALVESLPPDIRTPLQEGGAVRHWLERLEGSAEIVEATTDGAPVLMRSGKVFYLGGWPDDDTWMRILARHCTDLGIATAVMPEGLRLRDTARFRFAINYGPEPVNWQGHTVSAADVAWWSR